MTTQTRDATQTQDALPTRIDHYTVFWRHVVTPKQSSLSQLFNFARNRVSKFDASHTVSEP
jgi:hypothetical protein